MNPDYKHIGILLVLVIIASGCGDGGGSDTAAQTSPIQINSFKAVPNPVPAGQQVNLNMELKNTGDTTADKVAVRIFGPTFGDTTNSWRSSGGGSMVGKAARTDRVGQLRAPSDNNPAIPRRASWTLKAPQIGQNREVDYTFYAKVFYDYTTRGTSDFKLVSGERFRSQGYTQKDASVKNTAGPIQIDIRGTTPKIFYKKGDGDNVGQVNSEICVEVKNVGSGTAFTGGEVGNKVYSLEQGKENQVKISIQNVGNVIFEAKGSKVSGNTDIPVELVGGNQGYQCFKMTAENLAATAEQNVNAQITAEYNYVKETSTTVTVEGRK